MKPLAKTPAPYLVAGLVMLAPQAWSAGLGIAAPFHTIAPTPDSERWQLDGSWQLAPDQRLDFGLHAPRRNFDTGRTLWNERPDYELTGTAADRESDLSIYRFDYAFSVLQGRDFDLWGSLGLQMLDFDRRPKQTEAGRSGKELQHSLPTFGFGGRLALNPKWHLRGDLRYFDGGNKDWQGSLFDARLAVEYTAFDRMGIGLKYDFVSIDVQNQDRPLEDFYGLRFDRIGLYARMPFD